jgi:hypothetical protein
MLYILCLLYLVAFLGIAYVYHRKLFQHAVSVALISLFFPLGGIVFLWVLYRSSFATSRSNRSNASSKVADGFFAHEQDPEIASRIEYESSEPAGEDVVPLQETFLVSDFQQRRETLLNILKRDDSNYAGLIDLALRNEDSETAHYAASGYMSIKRKLDNRMRESQKRYQLNPKDHQAVRRYAEVLQDYLYTSGLLKDDRTSYLEEYARVLKELIEVHGDPSIQYIRHLLDCKLDLGDTRGALHYCAILERDYPETEEKYLTLLNCFFHLNRKADFERLLGRFRKSDIRFNRDTLEIVRFWLGDES